MIYFVLSELIIYKFRKRFSDRTPSTVIWWLTGNLKCLIHEPMNHMDICFFLFWKITMYIKVYVIYHCLILVYLYQIYIFFLFSSFKTWKQFFLVFSNRWKLSIISMTYKNEIKIKTNLLKLWLQNVVINFFSFVIKKIFFFFHLIWMSSTYWFYS